METIITRKDGKSVAIGRDRPLIIIGEKINPTGKKKLSEELLAGDYSRVRQYAIAQMQAGAHILDVNVGVAGINEPQALSKAVEIVMACTDLPLSIDSANPEALEAALAVYAGKPIINSVTGEEESLRAVLPLVKKYGTAVIGLPYDESGFSNDPVKRLEVARKILLRAEELGIPARDVLIDGLARPVGIDANAARATLETIRLVKEELGINTVLGISNISFGLPDRKFVNLTFLSMAMALGLTCAITDPTVAEIKKTLLAGDLLLGRDEYAANWIAHFRTIN